MATPGLITHINVDVQSACHEVLQKHVDALVVLKALIWNNACIGTHLQARRVLRKDSDCSNWLSVNTARGTAASGAFPDVDAHVALRALIRNKTHIGTHLLARRELRTRSNCSP